MFGGLRVTYEVQKSGRGYVINNMVDGWLQAKVSKEKLIDLMKGKADYNDLDWK